MSQKRTWLGIWLAALVCVLCLAGCRRQAGADGDAVCLLNLTQQPLTQAQAQKLQTEALEEAAQYQPLMEKIGPSETANLTLRPEEVAQIIRHLAGQGKTVVDSENEHNMENAESAVQFGRAVQTGQDASLTLYRVYRDGGFARMEFSLEQGSATLTSVRVAYDNTLKPQVVSVSRRDLPELRYTDKGYLIYRSRELDSVANAPGYVPYQMIRVTGLEDTCRQLCRRYIRPAGYANSNLFLTDWSQDDYGDLVWNDLFPVCYFLQTGVMLSSHTCADYLFDAATGLLIPAADYVRYIGLFFPLSQAELAEWSYLDQQTGCYPTRIFTSGDLSAALPIPEVVAWQENADGTLRLTVEALNFYYGTDCAFSHTVTIQPRADGGWYYLENRVRPDEHNRLPAYENTYP